MEGPPLVLRINRLSPQTVFPSDPSSSTSSYALPAQADPLPPVLPDFSFSPTHNYPAPFGTASLGSVLHLQIALENASASDVRGVRMMVEVQGPGGRYRLGEVVYGKQEPTKHANDGSLADAEGKTATGEEQPSDTAGKAGEGEPEEQVWEDMPALGAGMAVDLDVETELKELGMQIIICSVAWELPEGRRTFQRFYKFNVISPLSIKTRIHTTSTPNTLLDAARRQDVYLEVLMQNTSPESILFEKVGLEPVWGLSVKPTRLDQVNAEVSSKLTTTKAQGDRETEGGQAGAAPFSGQMAALTPGSSRQHLFLLTPSPPAPSPATADQPADLPASVFPPVFPGGTILPLGRLDLAWRSGRYHEKGRLQTSTLNRRVAQSPVVPKGPSVPGAMPSTPGRGANATAPGYPGSPARAPVPPPKGSGRDEPKWDVDVVVLDLNRAGVTVEQEFTAKLRVAIRSDTAVSPDLEAALATPPASVRLAIQYLTAINPPALRMTGAVPNSLIPAVTLSGPSRSTTPMSPPPSTGRPSPAPGASRPMTPVSSQLRQATTSQLVTPSAVPAGPVGTFSGPDAGQSIEQSSQAVDFPPPATIVRPGPPVPSTQAKRAGPALPVGDVRHLGSSMMVLPVQPFRLVKEQYMTTYAESSEPGRRWEAVYETDLRFIAFEEGLAPLGGLRVLVLEDESGLSGYIAREIDSLGDVWVAE